MSAGSMLSCSASTMAATVSGLLPQHGACSEITALPVASILIEALSGELVSANPGSTVEHPEFGGAEHALFLAAGDADADIAALRPRQLLLVAPAVVVEHLQRHIERAGIVAAVVEIAGRDLIGKFVRPDEIVAPERDRIEIEFVDGGVHDPLDHEVRHFGAETAAGALLAFVGEDGIDLGADRADFVGADGLRKTVAVRAEAVLEIGAVIVHDLVAQRGHPVGRRPAQARRRRCDPNRDCRMR